MLKMEPKMLQFSSLFRELPLLKLIFKLDIWFQQGKFTMNSYYPKLGDRHFKDFAFLDLLNPHCFTNWKNSVPIEKLELLERRCGPPFSNFLSLNSNFCLSIEILISTKQVPKNCWIASTFSPCNHVFLRFSNFCY